MSCIKVLQLCILFCCKPWRKPTLSRATMCAQNFHGKENKFTFGTIRLYIYRWQTKTNRCTYKKRHWMSPMFVQILIKLVSFHRLDKVFTLILAVAVLVIVWIITLPGILCSHFSSWTTDQCAVRNFYFPDKSSIPCQRPLSLLLLAWGLMCNHAWRGLNIILAWYNWHCTWYLG